VLDNNYLTWNALGNQYWPRKYLIDTDGYIIYDHIGEGGYTETEKAIQEALKERAYKIGTGAKIATNTDVPKNVITVDSSQVGSPEVYFGSARNRYFGNGISGHSGTQNLTLPNTINPNQFYLAGTWDFTSEYAESATTSEIAFAYQAKNVYMVASSNVGTEIEIYKDDMLVKKLTIRDEQLYNLISDSSYGQHILRIKIPKGALKAFTFTFG
jgi:hypothetical protein